MSNMYNDGLVFKNEDESEVQITPKMVMYVINQMKVQNGRDIVAVYTDKVFSDDQYYSVSEELDEILNADSGDDEYRACVEILGEHFDED